MDKALERRVINLEATYGQLSKGQEPIVVCICDCSKTSATPILIFPDPNTPETVKEEWRKKYPRKQHPYAEFFPEEADSK